MKPSESRIAIWKIQRAAERYQKRKAVEVAKIQAACQHTWAYHSDPSGGSDNGYSCVCGAWKR